MEERFGNIFACAPAIRQFFAYYHRVGTILPTEDRQKPDEDFVKLRRRINFRDIFWFRNADMVNGRVLEAKVFFDLEEASSILVAELLLMSCC